MAKIIFYFAILSEIILCIGALDQMCYQGIWHGSSKVEGSPISCDGACFKVDGTASGITSVIKGCVQRSDFNTMKSNGNIQSDQCLYVSQNYPNVGKVDGTVCYCSGYFCNGSLKLKNGKLWIPIITLLAATWNWI